MQAIVIEHADQPRQLIADILTCLGFEEVIAAVDFDEYPGGAMHISTGSPTVSDCVFTGNRGSPGGAIYPTPRIRDTRSDSRFAGSGWYFENCMENTPRPWVRDRSWFT